MDSLSEEQRRKIEENRRRAFEIRAAKASKFAPTVPNCATTSKATNIQTKNTYRGSDYRYKFFKKKVACDDFSTESVCSYLSSNERFSVNASYSEKLSNVFKTINGKRYDGNTRKWSFPLAEYNNLKKAVLQLNIAFGEIPKYVLKTFTNSSTEEKTTDISSIDECLRINLYPFQEEGVQFGIQKNGRCIIADDMGLGKTIQALGIAHYYYSDWPLLIVCPSSMRYQWEQEVMTYLPSMPLSDLFIMSSSKNKLCNPLVVITSYDLMSRCEQDLLSCKFGVMILDESHSMKCLQTKRTKVATALAKQSKRCIMLSGTPALSRPWELYPQMKSIDLGFISQKEFGIRYCDGKQGRYGWDYSGSSNMEELRLLLYRRFMIRRLKSDVLQQLPSKIRQLVILDPSKIKKGTKEMNEFTEKLSSQNIKGMQKRGTLLSYFAETAKAKLQAVLDYIADLLEAEGKFLIFAHHKCLMDAVSNMLEEKKVYYIRIDGTTASDERKSVCDQFQFQDKFRVAVLSITAASTGITLTAASLVVFVELFWNPGVLTQAEDRVHRIGQKDSVFVQYLMAKGTADDHLWPLVQSKLNILNQAGLSKDNFSCENTSLKRSNAKQMSILDYFDEMNEEDEDELNSVMDDIEEIKPKRIKC